MPAIELDLDAKRIKKTLRLHERVVFPRALVHAVARTTDRVYTESVRSISSETGIQQAKIRNRWTGRVLKFFEKTRTGHIGRIWIGSHDLTFSYLGILTPKGKLSKRGRQFTGGAQPFEIAIAPDSSKTILAVRQGEEIVTGVNIFERCSQVVRGVIAQKSSSLFTRELQGQLRRLSRGKIKRGRGGR